MQKIAFYQSKIKAPIKGASTLEGDMTDQEIKDIYDSEPKHDAGNAGDHGWSIGRRTEKILMEEVA